MNLRQIKEMNAHRMPPKYSYFWFCRVASSYFTWAFQWLPFTANQISLFGHFFLILSSFFFSFGDFYFNLMGVLCMHISILMDYVDGTWARVKQNVSTFVACYVDRQLHELWPAFILLGVGIGTFIKYNEMGFLMLGAIATLAQLATSYLFQLKNFVLMRYGDQEVSEHNFDTTFVQGGLMALGLKLFVAPMKYLRFVTLVFVLANMMHIFCWFYALFLSFRFVVYNLFMYNNFRRLDYEKK